MEPKVRATVDCLPFRKEGHGRARNISKTNYGKESEIVNVYVNNIVSLPLVRRANHEFWKPWEN